MTDLKQATPTILPAPKEMHDRLDSGWTKGYDPWEHVSYLTGLIAGANDENIKLRAEKEALEAKYAQRGLILEDLEYSFDCHKNHVNAVNRFCDSLEKDNESLNQRIAHLEALVVAVREEDVQTVEAERLLDAIDHPEDHGYQYAINDCVEALRKRPLPDARAEKIKAVVTAVEVLAPFLERYKNVLPWDDDSLAKHKLIKAYREYEEAVE